MRTPIFIIPVILSFVLLFSGCAHRPSQAGTCQPVSEYDYHFEEDDEFQAYNDRIDTSQCPEMVLPSRQVYHGDSDRELARFMGVIVYTIIEAVIRGMVYSLAHR